MCLNDIHEKVVTNSLVLRSFKVRSGWSKNGILRNFVFSRWALLKRFVKIFHSVNLQVKPNFYNYF